MKAIFQPRRLVLLGILCSAIAGSLLAEDSASESSDTKEKVIETILEEMTMKHGYTLAPKQAVCFVSPPFCPAREKLVEAINTPRRGARGLAAKSMTFFWRENRLVRYVSSSGGLNLSDLLNFTKKVDRTEIEGDEALVDRLRFEGDWVSREDASDEDTVYEIMTALQVDLQLQIQIEVQQVEREVYVARGEFDFKQSEGRDTQKNDVIYLPCESPSPQFAVAGETGQRKSFLNRLGGLIKHQVVDETHSTDERRFSWKYRPADAKDHDLLESVNIQTGLTLSKEARKVRRFIVSKRTDE
jgi:hypothetical protein